MQILDMLFRFCAGFLIILMSAVAFMQRARVFPASTSSQQERLSSFHMSKDSVPLESSTDLHKLKKLTFVSSNPNKAREVQLILGSNFPWEITCVNIDLVEPQATPVEVSIAKCKLAVNLIEGPVIVEDTSLCFNALNGLPGPYIKWFYESVGNDGLAKLVDPYEDKSAYSQCVLSFCQGPGYEIKTFVGSTDGSIVHPRGPEGFGWDPIFIVRVSIYMNTYLLL